jgi:cell division protein FtsA
MTKHRADIEQIVGMVNLARRMLGVSAHLGNPPLQVYAEDQHLAALRRSMYATASGLLMFSQSDLQDAVEEPEESNDRSFMDRVTNGWNALNSKLKAIF